MAKKNINIEEPDADPTVKNLTDTRSQKREIPRRYLFIAQTPIYEDLNALVTFRNLERIRTGARAYSLNQLLNDLVREYLEQDEVKAEVAKAHKTLKI